MTAKPGTRTLLAVASPAEAAAAWRAAGASAVESLPWQPVPLRPGIDLVITGIGKANAAACVARLLPGPYRAVISVGVAGSLPGSLLEPGRSVLADSCVYADEGLLAPEGFRDCAEMGFPLGSFGGRRVPVDPGLVAILGTFVDVTGPIATVSTCSGTNAAARDVAARTGALAEAMEGAAVAHVASVLGVPAAELRAISNTTGDRSAQRWDLRSGLDAIARVLGQAIGAL